MRKRTPDIGDPKPRIDLASPRHGLVRLIQPPGKGMAGRIHARCASVVWLLLEPLLGPRGCLVIAAGEEMTDTDLCYAGLADPRIKARFADLAATVFMGSPTDFAKFIADDTEKSAKVIKFAGIKPE